MPLEIKVNKAPTEPKATKVTDWNVGDCGHHTSGDLYIKTNWGAWCISCGDPYACSDTGLRGKIAIMDPTLKVTITVG